MPDHATSGHVRELARGRRRSPAVAALTGLLERTGAVSRVDSVFGEPVSAGGATVVPVARIRHLASAGLAAGRVPGTGADGGGGAGYASVRPMGYILLSGGGAEFRPIRRPAALLVLPLAVITAATAARIVGVSVRAARRRRRDRLTGCSGPAAAPAAEEQEG